MKVINLFGGPGTGKSTTAAGLYERFKTHAYNAELVTEYAKDMVWENRDNILADQLYILAKQDRRLIRLKGKIDIVITDSPVVNGINYVDGKYFSHFKPLVLEIWNSYENINIFLTRNMQRKYQTAGRTQGSIEEAAVIDDKIKTFLDNEKIEYNTFSMCTGITDTIFEFLVSTYFQDK